jgi:hypothetical protein
MSAHIFRVAARVLPGAPPMTTSTSEPPVRRASQRTAARGAPGCRFGAKVTFGSIGQVVAPDDPDEAAWRGSAAERRAIRELRDDLRTGRWARRNAGITGLEEMDHGARQLIT